MKTLKNCCYNKLKLLYKTSKILWFIEKHGIEDAKKANDENCYILLEEMKKDLEKHVQKLEQLLSKNFKS